MNMEFGLRNGPWKTIFDGIFQGHEIEISINPEQVMLISILEKQGEETTGVVLQVFSVFSAVGEAETFVESLQREAIVLSRHDGKRTVQFLALASNTTYSKAKEEEVVKTVDGLLEQVKMSEEKVKSIADSFDLHLTPLHQCSSAVKQSFFSQPLMIPMLAREKKTIEIEKEEASVEAGAEGAAVILGSTKDGNLIKEPLQLFERCIVTDGEARQRMEVMQVIIESYLLANTPVIIFDKDRSFAGLALPTRKISELQTHGVQIDPIGFPIKEFTPQKNLGVNLNAINPAGLLQLFGCNDEEAEKLLEKALSKGKVESIKQLVNAIGSLTASEAENQFLKRRLQRIIALVGIIYPETFAGENNIQEMVKTWFGKIGRASIVHTDDIDPRVMLFLLDSISNELVGHYKHQGETGKPKLLLVLPEISGVMEIKDNLVIRDFMKTLKEMQKYGIGFLIGTERRSDLQKEMVQMSETKAAVIKENDVAIDLPNSKNYRVFTRPTLSRLKEEQ